MTCVRAALSSGFFIFRALALLAVSAAFLFFISAVSVQSLAEEYVIGPEDVLDITVWGQQDLSKTVTVSKEGSFDYPLLGQIEVSGLTAKNLSELIERNLSKSYLQNPRVTVIVKEYNSQKVMVFGEINKPGMYKLKGKTTLLEFLAEIGGVSAKTKGTGSVLTLREHKRTVKAKDGKEKTVVEKVPIKTDLHALLYKGDMSQNIEVKPGDLLYVSGESGNKVYMMGQVKKPGPLEIGENVTVMEAINMAGGFTQVASPNRIRILRDIKNPSETGENNPESGSEEGERQREQKVIKVSVGRIMKGDKSQDVVLQAGDVVVVPEALF